MMDKQREVNSYREVGRILLVDEESVSQWVTLYQAMGLDGLKNHCAWGGEHGQRFLRTEQLTELKQPSGGRSDGGHKAGQWVECQSDQKVDP